MKKITRALSFFTALVCYVSAAVVPVPMVTVDGSVNTDPYPLKIMSMPIPGVKVYLQSPLAILQQQSTGISLPIVLVDSAITDATGSFAFDSVKTGSYSVLFKHPGYVSLTKSIYAQKDTTIRAAMLAIGAHGAVRGKVIAGCAASPLAMPCILTPLPKCTVTVSAGPLVSPLAKQTAAIYPPVGTLIYTAITNDSGNYSIDSIPISYNNTRVIVTAAKAGFNSQSVEDGLLNMTNTTANFSLLPNQVADSSVSVYTIPAKPTTNDSITYHFYDKNMCCGTQFVNPSVSVFDTQVYLGFSANTTPCQFVKCFVAGAGYDFKVGKLKAGKYGIYKAETFYCTTKVCPMIAIMPVRIGEVVVTTPLAIVPGDPATMPVEALVFEQGKSAINLDYLLEKQSYVRISVYNARGILAAHIYKGIASKGTHRFSWMATARGVYVMSVEVNGTQVAARKIIVSQ